MTAPPPGNGRNQVVDLSVIDTAWGNAVADRVTQSYLSQSDRDSMWPSPPNGSRSYTADTDEFWTRQGGKWRREPEGFIGQVFGPPARREVGDSLDLQELLRYDFPAKVGRAYLLSAYCNVQNTLANATTGVQLADDQGTAQWIAYRNDMGVNYSVLGTTSFIYRATSTKTAWAKINWFNAGAGSLLWTGPNWESITVTDIGGA